MQSHQTHQAASAIVLATGVLWGFYWLPVRALSDAGFDGAWGTVAIAGAAGLILAPIFFLRRAGSLKGQAAAICFAALGGVAFALYSTGIVYGRVAIIVLLFFLTPVWSSLIGKFVMGWTVSGQRIAAILCGLAGLAIMLGGEGALPVPRNLGEWMGLVSGLLWAVATTGLKARPDLPPLTAAFFFVLGGVMAALLLALALARLPEGGFSAGTVFLSFGTGGLWWGLSLVALMWATVRLEPARVGILLMSEVVVGAISAALLAGEHLSILEWAGGALVVFAGVLEVWPQRKRNGR